LEEEEEEEEEEEFSENNTDLLSLSSMLTVYTVYCTVYSWSIIYLFIYFSLGKNQNIKSKGWDALL
jgi:hypothetical protein